MMSDKEYFEKKQLELAKKSLKLWGKNSTRPIAEMIAICSLGPCSESLMFKEIWDKVFENVPMVLEEVDKIHKEYKAVLSNNNEELLKTKFKIHKKERDIFPVVVYSMSYDSPMNYITYLERKLNKMEFDGEVLFDLLLSNGTHDRFYETLFTDGKFGKTFSSAQPSLEIQEESLDFYSSNKDILGNSVLTKGQIFLIKNKILRVKNVK